MKPTSGLARLVLASRRLQHRAADWRVDVTADVTTGARGHHEVRIGQGAHLGEAQTLGLNFGRHAVDDDGVEDLEEDEERAKYEHEASHDADRLGDELTGV